MHNNRIIGHNIILMDNVKSTNNFVLSSIHENEYQEGTIVRAVDQTEGKGLDANSWESEAGKNLTFSIIIYPSFLPPQRQFMLNKFVSLGVYDFLKEKLPKRSASIKWPNDIYIDNSKACGILINNTIKGSGMDFSVIGMGLNINQVVFRSDAPNPVSLKQLTGKNYHLEECLKDLASNLDRRYHQLKYNKVEMLDADYRHALYRLDEWHRYQVKSEGFQGRVRGVDEYGKLLIEKKDGRIHSFDFKEVEYIL